MRAHQGRARGICSRLSVRLVLVLTMAAQDVFHAIFELQFLFLEGDFFELLGF
jgi:hypothetical protein